MLVTYMEGERYGLVMAGTAFAVMLPDILKFTSSGRFDLFLLGCVIWALIPSSGCSCSGSSSSRTRPCASASGRPSARR